MFQLAEEGFATLFQQLVACMISIRTRDEAMLVMARQLFEHARTPAEMLRLTQGEIDDLIRQSSFHEAKSRQIYAIARAGVEQYRGGLPCDFDTLTRFPGVGPKCASLVLAIACGQTCIGVDVHVHRVVNRWGYVHTRTPEETMAALARQLPRQYWVELNALLVPFGKHICTGVQPHCSTCPVFKMCEQIGVGSHR
jgi:endonuclease-3